MTDKIRFILNGEVREVSGISPTATLLQYLRSAAKLTGTKEGCAEGDCGACTVIVAKFENGKLKVRSINACIAFIATLDGCEIITVEYLKNKNGLHPVQKEMVDCHGSQCGFCTPGFVMSVAALLHNKNTVNDDDVQEAIAGNLCRCTGYRPIIDAAKNAAKAKNKKLLFSSKKLSSLQRDKAFVYKAEGRQFTSPRTVKELAEALVQYPKATLLAGGTDVGLWVTKHHRNLENIIYTGNVEEMRKIEKTAQGLEIGAVASYTEVFEHLGKYDETMKELLQRLGSKQIRNSGTLGGNIANGSPIGDGMPPLIALGAQIVLHSKKTIRTILLEDYFIAYGKQDRKSGEFIEKIIVPPKASNVLFKVYKISKRFDQDISAVCGAFALTLQKGIITDARIVFGGMAATPKRAAKTEKFLIGKNWNEEVAVQAMTKLDEDYSPLTDMRASAEYRSQVAQNLLYRFYLETAEKETATRVYNYGE